MKYLEEIHNQLTIRMLWVLALITIVFTYINMSQIAPNDFWWHMAIGRDILTNRQIPLFDIYSFTMQGQPYPSYQMFWLMETWFYTLFSIGGAQLVIFLHSLVITGTYAIILILSWQNSHEWGVTTLCLFLAIALGIYAWNVRPQAISFLIGSLFLYAIYAYRQSTNKLWLLVFPLGMLIWVNSHGTFPIGLVLLGIWLGDEVFNIVIARRRGGDTTLKSIFVPGIILLITTALCFINPRGLRIVTYLSTMISNQTVQSTVPEWAPPSFSSPIGPLFFVGLLLIILVMALSPRRPTFFQLLTFLAFTILALRTTRGVVWFGLVMAPILANHLSAITDRLRSGQKQSPTQKKYLKVNLVFLGILILLALISLPWFRDTLPIPPARKEYITQDTPISATEYLVNQQMPKNLFNDMGFGSYLIWAAQPENKVFVDPRIELYPQDIWMDYHIISNGIPGWEQRLEKYDARTLMLSKTFQEKLIEELRESGLWDLVYQDEIAVIYIKSG
jgi:hypothetical protein